MERVNRYIEKINNPTSWFSCYREQKLIAEILKEKSLDKEVLLKMKNDPNDTEFLTIWTNALYHWGIAIENGLKGIISKYYPEKFEIEVKGHHVILKSICGKAGKTHNLLQLAEIAGIFDKKKKFCTYQSDYDSLNQALLYLTDIIKWQARYPVSNNTATIFKMTKRVPIVLVYGFHILDVMEPLFELFENEHNTPVKI